VAALRAEKAYVFSTVPGVSTYSSRKTVPPTTIAPSLPTSLGTLQRVVPSSRS
jgi:hypothetical protein